MPQVEQNPLVCDQQMNDDGDLFAYCPFELHTFMCNGNQQQFMLLNIQHRKLHVGLISHVPGTATFSKRECKRTGKRYGIISFAYRITHPHAAAASRLRLPRMES